jgi:glycosyltransferase involved in cell wall biosynthesis
MMKYMDRPGRTFIRILSGTYAWADAIICQSEDMKADVMRDLGVSAPPVHLIHNPANPSMRFNADTVRPNRFVTLGRLSPEKGYDRMIRALSGLKGDWEWHIYGTGPLESELKRLATRSGLDSQVFFHAPTQHVSAVFATASVFLCGSYVEGFPNGVLESVLSGVPVVAFRSLGGTREIIRHGFNGFLAADEAEFRESAWKSLHETWDRHAMALEASERFSFETIMGRYESLFTRLTNA